MLSNNRKLTSIKSIITKYFFIGFVLVYFFGCGIWMLFENRVHWEVFMRFVGVGMVMLSILVDPVAWTNPREILNTSSMPIRTKILSRIGLVLVLIPSLWDLFNTYFIR